MATENILMDSVKAGGDRQELHEKIRQLSMEAGRHVKVDGAANDLLGMIAADPAFPLSQKDLEATMNPDQYTGCAAVQTERFLKDYVRPILEENKDVLGQQAEINV